MEDSWWLPIPVVPTMSTTYEAHIIIENYEGWWVAYASHDSLVVEHWWLKSGTLDSISGKCQLPSIFHFLTSKYTCLQLRQAHCRNYALPWAASVGQWYHQLLQHYCTVQYQDSCKRGCLNVRLWMVYLYVPFTNTIPDCCRKQLSRKQVDDCKWPRHCKFPNQSHNKLYSTITTCMDTSIIISITDRLYSYKLMSHILHP